MLHESKQHRKNSTEVALKHHQSRGVPSSTLVESNLSLDELRTLGEQHTGYVFLTFATAEDAKRALVLAKMNFEPFYYDRLENGPFVDLLRDDYHMDFDEDFQVNQIGKYIVAEHNLDTEVEKLREKVTEQEK